MVNEDDFKILKTRKAQRAIVDHCTGEFGCNCKEKRRKIRGSRAAHGTRARYQYGCDCIPCADANRAYQRAYRSGNLQKSTANEKENS